MEYLQDMEETLKVVYVSIYVYDVRIVEVLRMLEGRKWVVFEVEEGGPRGQSNGN